MSGKDAAAAHGRRTQVRNLRVSDERIDAGIEFPSGLDARATVGNHDPFAAVRDTGGCGLAKAVPRYPRDTTRPRVDGSGRDVSAAGMWRHGGFVMGHRDDWCRLLRRVHLSNHRREGLYDERAGERGTERERERNSGGSPRGPRGFETR